METTVSESDRGVLADIARDISVHLNRIAGVEPGMTPVTVLDEKLRPKTLTPDFIKALRDLVSLADAANAGEQLDPQKVNAALEFGPHVLVILNSTPHQDAGSLTV